MIKAIFFLPLLIGLASAETIPTSSSYMDFSGGLNTLTAPIYLQPNESPRLQNVVIDEPMGALTQRNGYTLCGNTPSGDTATNLYAYTKTSGAKYLIVTDNENIWQTPDCQNYTNVLSGLNSLFIPRFTTINDKLWIVTGSTWTSTWDGTTLTYLDGHNSSTPLAPKGRYIIYWKNRIWIAAPTSDPSAVAFNVLLDADGNTLDPATSTSAWLTTNTIYFGQSDGSPIYGLYPFRDNLMVFKEKSLWRLLFESEYNLNIVKSVSTIGSKFNDSIVEMDDGSLRYVGTDGIYKYAGIVPERMSTRITPTFYDFKQPFLGQGLKVWDTGADYNVGTLVNTDSTTYTGTVALNLHSTTMTYENFSDGNYTANPVWTFLPGVGGTNNFSVSTSKLLYNNTGTGSQTVYGTLYTNDASASTNTFVHGSYRIDMGAGSVNITRGYDGTGHGVTTAIESTATFSLLGSNVNPAIGNNYSISFYGGSVTGGGAVAKNAAITLIRTVAGVPSTIATSTCSFTVTPHPYGALGSTTAVINITVTSTGVAVAADVCTNTLYDTYTIPNGRANKMSAASRASIYCYKQLSTLVTTPFPYPCQYATASTNWDSIKISTSYFDASGTYTTEIATATGITGWSTYEVDEELNGGTLAKEIRTGASAAATAAATWRTITAGSVISSTATDTHSQARFTFTAPALAASTPKLNRAIFNWITGGTAISTIKGLQYKSRYWLSGSTRPANQYNDTTLVESKPPLGTYSYWDLPISAMCLWNDYLYGAIGNTSKIVRLDYGTTDDGTAIVSYWESRDDIYQNPIRYKSINKGILDYYGYDDTLYIGLSPDGGATFQTRTLNYNAGNRSTKIFNYDANMSQAFRMKILHNAAGKNYLIYGLHSLGTVSDFLGN